MKDVTAPPTELPAKPGPNKETFMTIHNLTEREAEVSRAARQVADDLASAVRQADVQGGYNEHWWEAVHRLQQEGYPTMFIPTQYGGAGAGVFPLTLVVEQLAKVDGGLANILFHEACSVQTILSAPEDLRREHFKRMIDGALTCICITEPNAGSDLAAMATVAQKVDGGYVINGEKEIASLGGVADVFLVWAKTDLNAGTRGISAFLFGRETPGIEVSGPADTLGFRQLPSHHVRLKNVEVPASSLLRGEGQGLTLFAQALNIGRLGGGVQSLGLATGAYEQALAFSRKRVAFGQPIIKHQAVQFKLADMFMATEAVRALAYSTARFMDASEDLGSREIGTYVAAIKAYASDMAMRVTEEAVEIFGAQGIWKRNDVERLFRDAKVCQLVDGPNELMRMRIAHALVKD